MALSQKSAQDCFKVFNALKLKNIQSFMPTFPNENEDIDDPTEEKTYANGECNGSFDAVFFFIENPTEQFIQQWEELKGTVNTNGYMIPFEHNAKFTMFGWF